MGIEYKYSAAQDFVYHILAHMKVENASNLYSDAYIDHINEVKNGRYNSLTEALSNLSDYYNENFERLGMINFLPFICSSVQDVMGAVEGYDGFTEMDRKEFIAPLNQLLRSEFEFYEGYWSKQYDDTDDRRKALESWMTNEMSKYEAFFAYFKKSAMVGLSYSLTRNGRGLEAASSFNAIVPFPFDESDYKNTFYQVLHEYTHQFTDKLVGENIRMDDGTHAISENAVILFDYYLIEKMNKEDADSYLKWVGTLANIENCDESLLRAAFKLDDDINGKLLELVEKIIG